MDSTFKVVVWINQQQEQLVDRLAREGGFGSTRAEVIREVFRRYCEAHPELVVARP